MNKNIEFKYSNGISVCIIKYKGRHFYGSAECHPDDEDFCSERTGLCIAEARANLEVLRYQRDCEIAPQIKILNHLLNNMQRNEDYNKYSYEAKMLRSQIRAVEKELATIKQDIADEKKYLKEYIDQKEKMYQRLRARKKLEAPAE